MKRLFNLLILLFAAVTVVSAQNTTTELLGKVIDENGEPLTALYLR